MTDVGLAGIEGDAAVVLVTIGTDPLTTVVVGAWVFVAACGELIVTVTVPVDAASSVWLGGKIVGGWLVTVVGTLVGCE